MKIFRTFSGGLFLFFLLFCVKLAYSQQINSQNYVISQWDMDQGLPQSSVNDIIQTRDGFIWLATYGGLVRFDGVNFTTYDRSNTPEMRSDRILHLYEDRNGSIWISTEEGLLRFTDGKIEPYLIYVGSQLYSPLRIKEDSDGRLWASVNANLYQFKNNTFEIVPTIRNKARAIEASKDSSGVWFAHEFEIVCTQGDSVYQLFDLSADLVDNLIDVVEYPRGSRTFFAASTGDGIVRIKNGKIEKFSAEDGLASRYTWRLYIDREEKLWVSSYNGISTWNGSNFERFTAISPNSDIQLSRVLQDNTGNYWIGSTNGGIYQLRPSIIRTISSDQGLDYDQMLSLSQLRNGKMLFATNCGGIWEWENGRAKESEINQWLPNLCVWSVFEDSRGDIWVGSRVLYKTKSLRKSGKLFSKSDGFFGQDIYAITEDSKGHIWIGCFNGTFVYDGENFRSITSENGLSYNDTRVIFEDGDTMWIGTSAGLNLVRNDSVFTIPLAEATDDSLFHEPYIRAINKDDDGVYWFGTYGNGIFRMDGNTISHIEQEDGLFDNIVSHLIEDENGNFWMGSNRGISRVQKADLNKFCDGRIDRVHAYSYGTGDGMLSSETNGGFQPNVINEQGKLYFPTVKGVAVVSTQNIEQDPEPPKVFIETLFNGNNRLPIAPEITLKYDNAILEVNYTALSFREPEKIQFKYKLEGLNKDWFNVGTNRTALFTQIPPGKYTFSVTASNNDGVWNPVGASFNIRIIPPFWETSWFYSLASFVFLLGFGGLYAQRINKLKRDFDQQKMFTEQLFESQELERLRIASELHDGLGQQILVIKNRAELAAMNVSNVDELKNQLQEIVQSAMNSINDVRNISHALRPVHLEKFGLTDALNHLCEELRETSSIDFSHHIESIDNFLPQKQEINFYRVIQEATNNILRHSKATEATVMVKAEKDMIRATIWDDGKGFDLTQKTNANGLGFLGMRERVATFGGQLEVESVLGQGTTLRITVNKKP